MRRRRKADAGAQGRLAREVRVPARASVSLRRRSAMLRNSVICRNASDWIVLNWASALPRRSLRAASIWLLRSARVAILRRAARDYREKTAMR